MGDGRSGSYGARIVTINQIVRGKRIVAAGTALMRINALALVASTIIKPKTPKG
jgi:hypothetical protein